MFITVVSCDTFETELEVDNLENPNDAVLASSTEAVEATAAGLFPAFYNASSGYVTPFSAMQMMADVGTCSWGNAGMRDMSSEPRAAWNNSVAYGNGNFTNDMFNALYAINSDANGIVFSATENGGDYDDANQLLAVGKFAQALTMGYSALVYDRSWLSDESGSIGKEPVDQNATMDFALAKLDEAIAIASANDFVIPGDWLLSSDMSSSEFAKLMSTFGARFIVMNSRSSAEKSATDWSKALAYANAGITSDFILTTDYAANIGQNDHKWVATQPGWARIDLRVINMMDSSYPSYLPAGETILPEASSVDARLALDFDYLSGQNFRPERGEYHYSSYRYNKYDSWNDDGQAGPLEEARVYENDLYKAEAMLNLGDASGAAAILNAGPRSTRGGLADIDASGVAAAIHYERVVELPLLSIGLSFFEMRKENLLQAGTLLHFPVPGKALEAGQFDSYTFGGTDGVSGEDYSSGGWR